MADNTQPNAPAMADDDLSVEELEKVAGGTDVNAYCPVKNTCNTVAGCGGTPTAQKPTAS